MQRRPVSKSRRLTTFDESILVESVTDPEVADVGVPRVGTSWSSSSRSAGCRTVRIGPAVKEVAELDIFVSFFYFLCGVHGMPPEEPFSTCLSRSRPGGTGRRLCCLDLYPMRFRACRMQA